jgi:hypothetical protein
LVYCGGGNLGTAEACHVWIGEKGKQEYTCKYNIKCVQGEENLPEDLVIEEDSKEDGDIVFGFNIYGSHYLYFGGI